MSIGLLLVAIVTSRVCAIVAENKGRRVWLWAILGFFGIGFSYIVLIFMPNLKKKEAKRLAKEQQA